MTRQRTNPARACPHRRRGDVDPTGLRPPDGSRVRDRGGRPPERPRARRRARRPARACRMRRRGVTATSTARLDGDLTALASSAIDGDDATAWQTPFAFVQGNVATYTAARTVHLRSSRPHRVRRRSALGADRAHDHSRQRHTRGRGRAGHRGRSGPGEHDRVRAHRSARVDHRVEARASSSPRFARHDHRLLLGDRGDDAGGHRRVGHRRRSRFRRWNRPSTPDAARTSRSMGTRSRCGLPATPTRYSRGARWT